MKFPVRVLFDPRAQKEVRALDPPVRELVLTTLERFAETGHGDVRPLKGGSAVVLRLRVGDYRVLFTHYLDHDSANLIRVVSVGHRREVYR